MSNNNYDDFYDYLIDYDGDGRIGIDDITRAQITADCCNNSDSSSSWKFNFGLLIAAILLFKIFAAIGGA